MTYDAAAIDRAARVLAKTMFFSWEGLPENLAAQNPSWGVGEAYHPSKQAFRDLAFLMLNAATEGDAT